MKNKKGISLITLVITIIVIVILAAAIIISLTKTNIIENANEAVEESKKGTANDEINLSTYELFVEENKRQMTKEEKREELENKLKEYDTSTTVELTETGFIANHRGYVFEISDKYEIAIKETENDTGTEEVFNPEEWDKTANSDDIFIWDEAGTTIVGYNENITTYEKIRIPSKCIAIIPNNLWVSSYNRSRIASGIKKIELPNTITKIGDYAFAEFMDLVEINIPDTVNYIGEAAFYSCNQLKNIVIPDSVTTIGGSAFESCRSLISVTMPKNITNIETRTFFYCSGLINITIPNSVTSIGEVAFYSCNQLKNIVIPENVVEMKADVFACWNSDQTIYCEAFSQPSGWDSSWKGYNFDASVVWGYKALAGFDATEWDKTATPDSAFIWDEAGTSIIGYTEELANYEKVRVPSKCISISADDHMLVTVSSRSRLVGGIKKVELPATISEIGEYAFSEFKDLKEINIPERVTRIGAFAFYNCISLTSVVIPKAVTYIGNATFDNWNYNQIIYCKVDSQPDGWGYYWYGYDCAANIVWGDEELIEFNAEEWDKTATPDEYFEWDSTGTIITGYKESIANNLTKIRIPSKCRAIMPGNVWVGNCDRSVVAQGIKKVELPETIVEIGRFAFSDFTDMEEINIPSSVSVIGDYVFNRCTRLNSIIIPYRVISMGDYVFYNWTSDQTIYCESEKGEKIWSSSWNESCNANIICDYKSE